MKTFVAIVLLHLLVFDRKIADAGKFPKFDYCSRKCPKGKNTMCDSKCESHKNNVKECVPNYEFRKAMVKWHNYYRDQVASGTNTTGGNGAASNMRAISYDMNLEFTIACWIYQAGDMVHDKCRGGRSFEKAGQNLYKGTKGDPDVADNIKNVVTLWFDEITLMKKEWVDKSPSLAVQATSKAEVGHFTQLVWAQTTHIGCAAVELKPKKGGRSFLVGCNYGPQGNYIDKPVYLRGAAASACPDKTTKNKEYASLCGESTLPPEANTAGIEELAELRGEASGTSGPVAASATGMVQLIAMSGIVMLLSQID